MLALSARYLDFQIRLRGELFLPTGVAPADKKQKKESPKEATGSGFSHTVVGVVLFSFFPLS